MEKNSSPGAWLPGAAEVCAPGCCTSPRPSQRWTPAPHFARWAHHWKLCQSAGWQAAAWTPHSPLPAQQSGSLSQQLCHKGSAFHPNAINHDITSVLLSRGEQFSLFKQFNSNSKTLTRGLPSKVNSNTEATTHELSKKAKNYSRRPLNTY